MKDLKVTLYQITNELDELDSCLEDQEESSKEILKGKINILLNEKLDSCVGYSQCLDDSIDLIDQRIEQLKKAKETIKNKKTRFHEYILFCLDNLGVTEIKGNINKIKVRAPSQKVNIFNESILPPEFIKVEKVISVKKDEIKKALKNGEEIPGVNLVFGERSLSFSIKTK